MEIKYSVCPHDCPDTCALKVEVEDGKIVKVAGDPSQAVTKGVICEKVRSYPERIYGNRILQPMRRTGKKGGGEFERISWNDAVDEIAKRWKELISKYGSESILPYSYGGTEGIINKTSMDRRLFNKIGATSLDRTICSAAGSLGYQLAYGESRGVNPLDSVKAKLIIFWGINALETNMHQALLAEAARKTGAKIIAVDVHRNKTAKWADDFYMILPGSDGALALGIAHIILRDGLEDKAFLEKYSFGFDEFRKKTVEYPPDKVAGITGLSKERIEYLAKLYAETKPSFLRIGNGLQHHKNGGINTWLISVLPALIGAWSYNGGGALKSNSAYFPLNDQALKRPDLLEKPVRTVNMVQLGKALCELKNPPIMSLYVYNSNPAVVAPNQNLVIKGLAREDLFTVVHEQTMTDTARWADIILPATTCFEHADLYVSYWHTFIQWADPVIPPLGEAKPNIEVFKLIADALGFNDECFLDNEEDIARLAIDILYWKEKGIIFERLRKERFIKVETEEYPFKFDKLNTSSGKIDFKSKKAAAYGFSEVPQYNPIFKNGNSASNHNYPLTFVSPPNHFFLNSSFAGVSSLKAKAVEPFLEINPQDAEVRGIKDGDLVSVENERGSLSIKTKVLNSVLPGVVASAGLWWKDDYLNGSGVNALTNDDLSDIGGGATFFSSKVEVKKI
ncbi:MAG: molybdopterin-containing oxidoreductase family protein [Candidatus Acidulodesulfobacterium sp.]